MFYIFLNFDVFQIFKDKFYFCKLNENLQSKISEYLK